MKYVVDFEGWITVEAKNRDEAQEIFWNWVGDMQDNTLTDWRKTISMCPTFECDGVEEN